MKTSIILIFCNQEPIEAVSSQALLLRTIRRLKKAHQKAWAKQFESATLHVYDDKFTWHSQSIPMTIENVGKSHDSGA